MKHKIKNKALGRKKSVRSSMYKNMISSLINEGKIVTTQTKGKELKRHFEPLVTSAKEETTLAKRRQLITKLGNKEDVNTLIDIAKNNKERTGGYLKLTKMPAAKGNNAPLVKVELLK